MTRRATSARYIDSRSPWWKSAPNSGSPSIRASWSLALKSAAVSDANAVGSNATGWPTVATSWPVRSTMSAVRALDSCRNDVRMSSIRRESSSRNDQLDAPDIQRRLRKRCLHAPEERFAAAAEHRLHLPRDIIPEQPHRLDAPLPGEELERRHPAKRVPAEQVAAVMRQPLLGEHPPRRQAQARHCREHESARSHH